MKIKLFYSYSHKDSEFRENLETNLALLRDNKIIDGWHDEKIIAGDNWNQEIENNMTNSHIILLLLSSDFIASEACKQEVDMALKLKQEKGVIFIPIILRNCAWKDIEDIANIEVLPQKGKPITQWDDIDSAWGSVYEGIKLQIEKIKGNFTPVLKECFNTELLKNPIADAALDKLFVYPDILEINKSTQKLEKNEINSSDLKNITNFTHKYVLIEGDEQSGKTSLCRMLYLHYVNIGFYPILLNGGNITGRADIKTIVEEEYDKQYDFNKNYWSLPKEEKILIIDDINNRSTNNQNHSAFLRSIEKEFGYAIVLIDKLSNLSDKSTENNYFYLFDDYSMQPLGHVKRDELIKKCIANDENIEFSVANTAQVARLDKDTKHINTIIGSNIVPSYPVFIVSTFNIIESAKSHDMTKTSYGHCYHALITMQLYRANIKAEDMDEYFKFLTEFSYFIFKRNKKSTSQNELDNFIEAHKKNYIFDEKIIKNLINSNTLIKEDGMYSFQYIYIYYYFIAKYLSDNINIKDIENQIDDLLLHLHKKDNSNIIVFITHHTENTGLLNSILFNTMVNFEKCSEATLENSETQFIAKYIARLKDIKIPSSNHHPESTRNEQLKEKDISKPTEDKFENEAENEEHSFLSIEIKKSARSIEIIGQIMRNQSGTFKRDRLNELFAEGQNTGLRLLKSFIDLMNNHGNSLNEFFEQRLLQIAEEQGLSKDRAKSISREFVTKSSYRVIFGWIYKIVNSLGYDKLIDIADNVNSETNTVASRLINFSIHAWHKKELDFEKLKSLYKDFKEDKNETAMYLLKDIVSRHIYMHKIDFREKQRINSLLDFGIKEQLSAQSKIK